MANFKKPEAWYSEVADRMVRNNLSMRQAAIELGIDMAPEVSEAHTRRRAWQKALWEARQRYYKELGADPARDKQTTLGMMALAVQKLMEEGAWDKALEGALKIAKIEGWLGPEQSVNVFAGLNTEDIENIKQNLKDFQTIKDTNGVVN